MTCVAVRSWQYKDVSYEDNTVSISYIASVRQYQTLCMGWLIQFIHFLAFWLSVFCGRGQLIIMWLSFVDHVLILSVCLSFCLSVPCFHLEGKRKGLRIPNSVGRAPGTPAPRGSISRSRGQRSRSRRLIALLTSTYLCLLFAVYIESLTKL